VAAEVERPLAQAAVEVVTDEPRPVEERVRPAVQAAEAVLARALAEVERARPAVQVAQAAEAAVPPVVVAAEQGRPAERRAPLAQLVARSPRDRLAAENRLAVLP
jgi:hypothetical protein